MVRTTTDDATDEELTRDDFQNTPVRVCHKTGRVVDVNKRSYTVAVELGGVNQHVVVTPEYAHEHVVDGGSGE